MFWMREVGGNPHTRRVLRGPRSGHRSGAEESVGYVDLRSEICRWLTRELLCVQMETRRPMDPLLHVDNPINIRTTTHACSERVHLPAIRLWNAVPRQCSSRGFQQVSFNRRGSLDGNCLQIDLDHAPPCDVGCEGVRMSCRREKHVMKRKDEGQKRNSEANGGGDQTPSGCS